tara:strand:- start:1247 stop:2548 length:1302 start_codon:yes stop_codon:yes gene_type:complete
MAIGRFTANTPWAQKVDPVSAFTQGAKLGAEQAATQTSLLAKQQQMQQAQQAFPAEQRARNLANQKAMLDMAMANEQREARLDALELGNQATAQNLVLRREEHDLNRITSELNWKKSENEIAIQGMKIADDVEYEDQRGLLQSFVADLNVKSRDPMANPIDIQSLPLPSSLTNTKARAEAIQAQTDAASAAAKSLFSRARISEENNIVGLIDFGLSHNEMQNPESIQRARTRRNVSHLRALAGKYGLDLSPTNNELAKALNPDGLEVGESYYNKYLNQSGDLDVASVEGAIQSWKASKPVPAGFTEEVVRRGDAIFKLNVPKLNERAAVAAGQAFLENYNDGKLVFENSLPKKPDKNAKEDVWNKYAKELRHHNEELAARLEYEKLKALYGARSFSNARDAADALPPNTDYLLKKGGGQRGEVKRTPPAPRPQ